MENSAVILGNSPFLKEVEGLIPEVLKKNYSLGINNIIDLYRTDVHVFLDVNQVNRSNLHKDIKALCRPDYKKDLVKDNIETFESIFFKPEEGILAKEGELSYAGFTHDYAISYCIYKNFKRVFLIGIADFLEGGHYTANYDFNYFQPLKQKTIDFIDKTCSKYIDIYTCNPSSPLKVPYIDIRELLK